jgi:hypothetical protein
MTPALAEWRGLGYLKGMRRMGSQEIPEFLPGDFTLCPGRRVIPHVLTRWVTQSHDERPTCAVHTAHFLSARNLLEMQAVAKGMYASNKGGNAGDTRDTGGKINGNHSS